MAASKPAFYRDAGDGLSKFGLRQRSDRYCIQKFDQFGYRIWRCLLIWREVI